MATKLTKKKKSSKAGGKKKRSAGKGSSNVQEEMPIVAEEEDQKDDDPYEEVPEPEEVAEKRPNQFLLRMPRDVDNAGSAERPSVKINARLLKEGIFGKASFLNEEQQMDRMMKAKVVRLDNRNIDILDGLELVDQARKIYLQGNNIKTIENLDFQTKLVWLNLSDNFICTIENLAHLVCLQVLDLSKNNIGGGGEDPDYFALPKARLKVLSLYGNPCSRTKGYRTQVRSALPRLKALDGSRVDIDTSSLLEQVSSAEDDAEEEEKSSGHFQASASDEDGGDSLFQCDGGKCQNSIIYGTRFCVRSTVVGVSGQQTVLEKEKIIDLCMGCAYELALQENGGGPVIHISNDDFIDDQEEQEGSNRSDGVAEHGNQYRSYVMAKLDMGVDQARESFQAYRTEVIKRSNERLKQLKNQRREFENRKAEVAATVAFARQPGNTHKDSSTGEPVGRQHDQGGEKEESEYGKK